MNRKTFIASLFGLIGLASTAKAESPKIRWGLGRLAFWERTPSKPYDPFYHVTDAHGNRVTESGPGWNITVDATVEIGLRDDGVLVWRTIPADSPKP